MTRARAGFTLLEALFTVALTAIVVAFVMNFYLDIAGSSQRATATTRELRSAAAVLDRVTRDLEGAYLARRPADSQDPLEHSWMFLAERGASFEGASRLKFTTQSHRVPPGRAHHSDIATVSYLLEGDSEQGFVLMRHVVPRIPEGIDRRFPDADAPGVSVVADDLASFSMRFQAENGAWTDEWDSSLLEDGGELPLLVDIELSILPDWDEVDAEIAFEEGYEPERYGKRVALLQRPLDHDIALGRGGDAAADQASEGDVCQVSWLECLGRQPEGQRLEDQPPQFRDWLRANPNACHGWDPSNVTPTYTPTLCLE